MPMKRTGAELRGEAIYPPKIRFLPYVGKRYENGIDGQRVLLLGESHYIRDKKEISKAGGLRRYTRYIFEDCERESLNRAWGTFFRRLDSIVTRTPDPSGIEAANAWSYVAFANLVQAVVGERSGDRPGDDGWKSGREAFPLLLEALEPDVVLVIGRQAFNNTPSEPGRMVGEISTLTSSVKRALWEMDYPTGRAMMTWVYHPARPNDSKATYIEVFRQLLKAAQHE